MNDGTKIKILNIPLSKNSLCVLEKIDEANRDWTGGNDRVLITRHMKEGKKKEKKKGGRNGAEDYRRVFRHVSMICEVDAMLKEVGPT